METLETLREKYRTKLEKHTLILVKLVISTQCFIVVSTYIPNFHQGMYNRTLIKELFTIGGISTRTNCGSMTIELGRPLLVGS